MQQPGKIISNISTFYLVIISNYDVTITNDFTESTQHGIRVI